EVLQRIAEAGGGSAWVLSPSGSEIDSLARDLGAMDRSGTRDRTRTVYAERFQIPLTLAVLSWLLFLFVPSRRNGKGPAWAAALALLAFSDVAQAVEPQEPEPGLDVYLENRGALKAFESG